MIIAFVIMLILLARILATSRIEYGLAMAVVLALLAPYLARETFSNLNSRCPACKGVMGSVIVRARFCPMCGTQLVPDEKLDRPAEGRQ